MAQDETFFNTSYDVSNPGAAYIDGGGLFPNNGSRLGQYQAGVQIRRNSRLSLQNAVIAGYPVGVMIENDKLAGTQENATATGSTFKNTSWQVIRIMRQMQNLITRLHKVSVSWVAISIRNGRTAVQQMGKTLPKAKSHSRMHICWLQSVVIKFSKRLPNSV